MINKEPFSVHNDAYENTYYLYENNVRLRNGWTGKTYYFSKEKNMKALLELPEGYEVVEGPISKMFFLRKKGPKTKKHVKVIKTT
jgi:YHS domain-containing protein